MAAHAAALTSTALAYFARQLPLAAGSYRHDLAMLFIWRHVACIDKPVGPATAVARESLNLLVASMSLQYAPLAAALIHEVFQSDNAPQRQHLVASRHPVVSNCALSSQTYQNSSYSHVTESLRACLGSRMTHTDAALCAPEELFLHHSSSDACFRLNHLCVKVSCISSWTQCSMLTNTRS
jgi:hypothetical protein